MNLAIVGAGASGAAAAYRLRETDYDVTVFEKSRGVCGRAATRRKHGCTYDHGANYVKSGSDRVDRLLTETLSSDGLADIEAPVWTFGADGEITPAHIRAAMTQTHLAIPVKDGRMRLGRYQGIFLFEHRSSPKSRHVALHLQGT